MNMAWSVRPLKRCGRDEGVGAEPRHCVLDDRWVGAADSVARADTCETSGDRM